MKAVRPVIGSNGASYLQNEVDRIAPHIRKGEGIKEEKDGIGDKPLGRKE